MARIESTTLPAGGKPGRAPKYPWDEWLDGQQRLLLRGEDFDVPPSSIRASAHQVANRRGLRVTTRLVAREGHKGAVNDATAIGVRIRAEENLETPF